MSEYNEPKAQSTQANVLQGVEAKKKKKTMIYGKYNYQVNQAMK